MMNENHPAATPVTVEAPPQYEPINPATGDWSDWPEESFDLDPSCKCMRLENHTLCPVHGPDDPAKYRLKHPEWFKLVEAPPLATTKPIGDVEAVAQKIEDYFVKEYGDLGLARNRPDIDEIVGILSPFFAPAGPAGLCPKCKSDTFYIECNRCDYDFMGNVFDVFKSFEAQPPCSECATLRKERDDFEKAIAKALRFAPSEEEPEECAPWMVEAEPEPMGPFSLIEAITAMMEMFDREFSKADKRAEAAEAQLSTLRDALEKLISRIEDAGVEDLALVEMESARAALAPTPEVAPKE